MGAVENGGARAVKICRTVFEDNPEILFYNVHKHKPFCLGQAGLWKNKIKQEGLLCWND